VTDTVFEMLAAPVQVAVTVYVPAGALPPNIFCPLLPSSQMVIDADVCVVAPETLVSLQVEPGMNAMLKVMPVSKGSVLGPITDNVGAVGTAVGLGVGFGLGVAFGFTIGLGVTTGVAPGGTTGTTAVVDSEAPGVTTLEGAVVGEGEGEGDGLGDHSAMKIERLAPGLPGENPAALPNQTTPMISARTA